MSTAAALERVTDSGPGPRRDPIRPSPVAAPWVDPFLVKLVGRSSATAPLIAVVAAAEDDVLDPDDHVAARLSNELGWHTSKSIDIVPLPSTGSAIVRGTAADIGVLCERSSSLIVSASRVDRSPVW